MNQKNVHLMMKTEWTNIVLHNVNMITKHIFLFDAKKKIFFFSFIMRILQIAFYQRIFMHDTNLHSLRGNRALSERKRILNKLPKAKRLQLN